MILCWPGNASETEMIAASTFDLHIDRRGSNCAKWDKMEAIYGVPASEGIAMWVADMDFRPPRSEERRVGKECRSRWSPYH